MRPSKLLRILEFIHQNLTQNVAHSNNDSKNNKIKDVAVVAIVSSVCLSSYVRHKIYNIKISSYIQWMMTEKEEKVHRDSHNVYS